MSSPFQTIEEFNGAIDGPTGGAIYTFAGSPAINNIALVVSVGLFIWFAISTYATRHPLPKIDKSLNSLITLVVVGLLSLVANDFRHQPQSAQANNSEPRQALMAKRSLQAPLGLLGMVGIGLPNFRGAKAKRKKRKYGDRYTKPPIS